CRAQFVRHVPERLDARMRWNLHFGRSGHDQREALVTCGIVLEVVEQGLAALVPIDTPEIQHVFCRNTLSVELRSSVCHRHDRFDNDSHRTTHMKWRYHT